MNPLTENLPQTTEPLAVGLCATLACQMEATAAKPGNVHRGADFEDLTYFDFMLCAAALGPIMERASQVRVGKTILSATRTSRQLVSTNVNLGMVLLLAPLAAVPRSTPLAEGIGPVLANLQPADADDVFAAIRLAAPGGLGESKQADVAQPPTMGLVDAMRVAEDRDLVARQFTTNFDVVLNHAARGLADGVERGLALGRNIVRVHLQLLSKYPDSLIARKCGRAVAQESADRASEALRICESRPDEAEQALADFDFWLRCDGHRRNPGSTADLVAAGLFVVLREGILRPPFRFYETCLPRGIRFDNRG